MDRQNAGSWDDHEIGFAPVKKTDDETGTRQPAPARSSTSVIDAFIQGNYFYVISAVMFMAGCYMLMKAPFITGSVFQKTLKSFSVLAGYELLLLGAGALITRLIGRGGDVVTLFLVAFVLLLDPTFFANAFHTIRQPEAMGLTLAVCAVGLGLSVLKFEIFRRLLQFRVSWRFYGALLMALLFAWMNGLLFRVELTRTQISQAVFALSWAPAIVTLLAGEPAFSFAWKDGAKPRFVTFLSFLLPAITAMHIAELSYLQNASLGILLFLPLIYTGCYALLRGSRGTEDTVTAYLVTDFLCCIALMNTLVTDPEDRMVIPRTVAFTSCAIATALLYAYGYWKHRSQVALYHLYACGIGAVISAMAWLLARYGSPFPPLDWNRINEILTPATLFWLLTAISLALAIYKKYWYFWLLSAMALTIALWHSGLLEKVGIRGFDIFSLLLFMYFIAMVLRRASNDSLNKIALVMLAYAAIVYFADALPIALGILLMEMITVMAVAVFRKQWILGILALLPLVIFAEPILRTMGKLHSSVYALAFGALFFLTGIVVTFQKARRARLQPSSSAKSKPHPD